VINIKYYRKSKNFRG